MNDTLHPPTSLLIPCPACGGLGRLAIQDAAGGFQRAEECRSCEGHGEIEASAPKPRLLYVGPCTVCGCNANHIASPDGPSPDGDMHARCRGIFEERRARALADAVETEPEGVGTRVHGLGDEVEPAGTPVIQDPGFRVQ